MPLSRLAPPGLTSAAKTKAAITMTMNSGDKRVARFARVIIRAHLLSRDLPWLKYNARVDVEIGNGADEGYLRIAPGTDFRLMYSGGGKTTGPRPLMIMLPPLPGSKDGEQKPVACDYSAEDGGCLLVDMPLWAYTPAPRPAAPTTSPVPQEKLAAPYKIGAPSHADVLKSGARRK